MKRRPWQCVLGLFLATAAIGPAQEKLTKDEANTLLAQARKAHQAADYAQSLPLFEKLSKVVPSLWGEDSPSHATILNDLGAAYQTMGQFTRAESLYQRSLKIREKKLGADHADVAVVLANLGSLYKEWGRFARAEPIYQRSLTIREVKFGPDHVNVSYSLNLLGGLYLSQGDFAKAEEVFLRSLRIRESKLGPGHALVAQPLINLGNLWQATGDYAKAESHLQRALEISEKANGPDHLSVALAISNQASLYQAMGDFSRAESLVERCLKMRENKLPPDHPLVAQALNHLAMVYLEMDLFAKAEPLFQRSLQIREAKFGPDHPDVATALHNLARWLALTGQITPAEALFRRALKIRETVYGPDHPDVATTLDGLAEMYRRLGLYGRAEPLYERSLKIREAQLGPDHVVVSTSLNNLALLHQAKAEPAKAEPLLLRSLKIREAKLVPDHPYLSITLNNLGLVYYQKREFAKAEPMFERAIRIRTAKYGPHNAMVAVINNNLAALHRSTGQYAKAETLQLQALEIARARFDRHHPTVLRTEWELAKLYAQTDRRNEAARLMDRMLRSMRVYSTQVLPILTEHEQLAFLKVNEQASLNFGLSLTMQDSSAENRHRAATWLLNAKAVAQESLSERLLLARDNRDAQAGAILAELTVVRQELARLALAGSEPDKADAVRRRRDELQAKETALSGKLVSADDRRRSKDRWIELDDMRVKLSPKTIYVDFACLDVPASGPAKKPSKRYVAWVTPRVGEVEVVDLGDASAIDAAIREVRRSLQSSPKEVRDAGEPHAEQNLRSAMRDLSQRLLEPLRRHLASASQWILCPDGNLWLVPWAALPLDEKTFAIENHAIQFVVTGRDLVINPLRLDQKKSAPAIFADPDFDADARAGVSLAGQSMSGILNGDKVHWEFHVDGKLVIRAGGAQGEVVGRGTWKQSESEVVMETQTSTYAGQVRGAEVAGIRRFKNAQSKPDLARGEHQWSAELPPAMRSAPRESSRISAVARLPGTATEAAAVAPRLERLASAKPVLFAERDATTRRFMELRSPRVLMMATHGFFLPDQDRDAKDRDRTNGDDTPEGAGFEDPLLRCGLLLAGCNNRQGTDTGILTGREIISTDFRGTDLVVLSACETGLGDVRNGEGVAGLRQAFQLAGAESVVASLWQVPDRDTALLMVSFFDNLAKGMGKAEALREAQRERIADRRKRFGAAHPFFWAAFTVTGR